MILPKDRDPRFITVRRGGTLQDSDHRLLAEWAADCAEHVLHLFEAAQPAEARPRQAIELARDWVRGRSRCLKPAQQPAMRKPRRGIYPVPRGMRRMLPGWPRR